MASFDCFSLLRLHRVLAGEPIAVTGLVRAFGDADTLFREVDRRWLEAANFPSEMISRLLAPLDGESGRRLERDMEWVSQPGHALVTLWDDGYPPRLAGIADAPPVLFIRGDPAALAGEQIAIVGSRKMTAMGRRAAQELAAGICRAGITVTSGLALGIDGAAHRGALEAGGRTIAVLACGCDQIYPARHRRLGEEVAAAGAVVSELPLGTPPWPGNFPRRNRIVTGLSRGTVVVEAALGSGSLVSARLAAEQGRDVFAVPGPVFGSQSKGCHALIKAGAMLVESVTDILDEIPGEAVDRGVELAGLSETQALVIESLRAAPASVDELAERLALPASTLLDALVELEIDGLVSGGHAGYEARV